MRKSYSAEFKAKLHLKRLKVKRLFRSWALSTKSIRIRSGLAEENAC